MHAQRSAAPDVDVLQTPGAFAHLLRCGFAGVATLSADGTVRSRDGTLSCWLPEIDRSGFESPVLSGFEEDFEILRRGGAAAEPLFLPGVRVADTAASPRCHILITWNADAHEYAVLTTVDQVDRPIDHWVLQQKREQRLLEEKLIVASRELKRVNEDLRQFTSVAAHDLQAPLRQIGSFAALLRGSLCDTPARAVDCLDAIEVCAARLTQMITGLLDQARLGSEQIHFETVDLRRVIDDVRDNLSDAIAAVEADIVVGELPEVHGSPTLLINLFQNLIANSLRYRSPDRLPCIAVTTMRDAETHRICVSDNGIGVPAQYAEAIFGSFVRVPQQGIHGGVGLGLGTCRRIADLHGWSLALDTSQATGARFCVSLPVSVSRFRGIGRDSPSA